MAIEFSRLTLRRLNIPFRLTFAHAGKARSRADQILVEMTTTEGVSGFGEMLPRPYVTGETMESCWAEAQTVWWPRFARLKFDPTASPRQALAPLFTLADHERRLASYAGFDVAVFDACARASSRSVEELLRPNNGSTVAARAAPLVGPIGFGSAPRFLAAAFAVAGCRNFKVKVGDSGSVERVRAVAHWSMGTLNLDANRAFSAIEAAAFLRALDPRRVRINRFEDPCRESLDSAECKDLCDVAHALGVKIVTDEYLVDSRDADVAAAFGDRLVWNLRLGKNGGLSGVLTQAERARRAGATIRLGAMVGETQLMDRATRAVLAALPAGIVEARESSFPRLLLRRDVWRQERPEKTLGLGLRPSQGALDQSTVEKIVLEA